MQYILQGIGWGLTLTVLLGPIFVALTETSIRKGFRPGLAVGLGVWSSDFIIITLTYFFIQSIQATVASPDFQRWVGIAGGLVLIGFGLASIFRKMSLEFEDRAYSARNYLGFWTKGFLVNTVNPFTFVFWIGIMGAKVIAQGLRPGESMLFLGSILGTIIITDFLKVVMAKWLRNRLKSHHILWFGRLAGIGLFIFGVALIARVTV